MASTGAGTLYPPHCMPEETFDIEKIRSLALTALCISKGKQDSTLAHQNVDQNLNDQVMKNLLTHYPQVLHTLLEDGEKYE